MHPTIALTPVVLVEAASAVPSASSRAAAPATVPGAPSAAAASPTPSANLSTTPRAEHPQPIPKLKKSRKIEHLQ